MLSLLSACVARSEISARAAVRRAYFAIFAWVDGTLKKAESLRNGDAHRARLRSEAPRSRGAALLRCWLLAAPVSFAVRYHCDEGQRGKFVNVTVVILFVV